MVIFYPGGLGALGHHEHEAEVDQVGAAADADHTALKVRLRLPHRLERRQDLRVLESGGRERERGVSSDVK